MFQVALSSLGISQAKTASFHAIVFDLENDCPATGHLSSRLFTDFVQDVGAKKNASQKTAAFPRKYRNYRRFRSREKSAKQVGMLRAIARVADEKKGVSDSESVRPRPPPRPARLSFLTLFRK
jgi:hypothetical protein